MTRVYQLCSHCGTRYTSYAVKSSYCSGDCKESAHRDQLKQQESFYTIKHTRKGHQVPDTGKADGIKIVVPSKYNGFDRVPVYLVFEEIAGLKLHGQLVNLNRDELELQIGSKIVVGGHERLITDIIIEE